MSTPAGALGPGPEARALCPAGAARDRMTAGAAARQTPPEREPMPHRILLTQLRRIGDVLMTTPAVAAVRAAHPEAHIAYLTEPPSDQVFAHSPHVDEVIRLPRRATLAERLALLARLRRARYDVVVDFFGNPRSALLTRLTGAPRRIGPDFAGRRWAYTERIDPGAAGAYAAAHKAALVAPLGARPASLLPRVFPGPDDAAYAARQLAALGVAPGDFLVALSPVSRQPYKVWPAERFAAVADALVERHGARVLFVWGPGEAHFVEAVRRRMTRPALPDYPVPTLLQLAALLARARLYVGNDNGPRHFAVAVGTPTVAVFGRPQPANWTPPGEPRHRAVAHDPGCKSRCTYPACDLGCILGVALDDVLRETLALAESLTSKP